MRLIHRREAEDFKAEKYSKCAQYVVDFDVSAPRLRVMRICAPTLPDEGLFH